MAAPHVAGAAALYKATHPSATPTQVKSGLQSERETIELPNDSDGIDEGVLNIGGAFDPNPPPDPDPDPDPSPPPPDDDVNAPTVQWQAPVGNDQEYVTGGGTVALQAAANDDVAVGRVEFWLYSLASESWVHFGTDYTAPYQSSINASSLDLGSNYISADAYDPSGNWDYELISIYNSGEPTLAPEGDNDSNKDKPGKKPKKVKKDKKKNNVKRKRRR